MIKVFSMIIVAVWLDGSIETQRRLQKTQQGFDTHRCQNIYNTFLSLK